MQVRHKKSGMIISPVIDAGSYYIFEANTFSASTALVDSRYALPKEHYEEVPTETWRDVTGEVELMSDQHWHHGDWSYMAVPTGYRLRKVDVVFTPPGSVFETGKMLEIRHAFIVEKKETT